MPCKQAPLFQAEANHPRATAHARPGEMSAWDAECARLPRPTLPEIPKSPALASQHRARSPTLPDLHIPENRPARCPTLLEICPLASDALVRGPPAKVSCRDLPAAELLRAYQAPTEFPRPSPPASNSRLTQFHPRFPA